MTLNELLIIKAALNITWRSTDIHKKAIEYIEREIRMKEIERAHPFEPTDKGISLLGDREIK